MSDSPLSRGRPHGAPLRAPRPGAKLAAKPAAPRQPASAPADLAEERDAVIVAMRQKGEGWQRIAERVGMTRDAVARRYARLAADAPAARTALAGLEGLGGAADAHSALAQARRVARTGDAADWAEHGEGVAESLLAKYDWLRPVVMAAPLETAVTQTPNPYIAVIGDTHFPKHDPATIALFLEAVRVAKPYLVVLNADICDLLAVSRHPKSHRTGRHWSLRDEVTAYHEFLHQLKTILAPWDGRIVQTNGNHDGDGDESRWWRYLNEQVPELISHPRGEEMLSFRNWFLPEWGQDIQFVKDHIVADDLKVFHGHLARKGGGQSARAHADVYETSLLHSHTHRIGSSSKRVPGVGKRGDWSKRVYEIGCGCSLRPDWMPEPDWANGFALICDGTDDFGVELVEVRRERAVVASLGMTLVV